MNFKHFNAILLVAIIFMASCTPYKTVPYFQNLKRDSINASQNKITNYSPLTIQPGDLIGLHVTSLNREADAEFNYNLERPSGLNSGSTLNSTQSENVVYGYLVDNDGNIKFPEIGNTKVQGRTTTELAKDLESKLAVYLTRPNIAVRLLNFKISVIGDVLRPGKYDIQNEKVTLPEALALAGDLNTTGLRNNVLLIREIDGVRETITLDLQSKKMFDSPYYYLKNNDVIYVTPNKDRVAQSDSGVLRISLIISALSVLAIFFTKL